MLYNGCDWNGRALAPYVRGTDGYAVYDDGSALNGRTTTGYYLRKMLNEGYTDYSKACTQPWIRMPKAAAICRTSSSPVRPLRRGGGAEEADRGKQDWMAPMNWYVRS